ncbi:MAG: helix-turn-helix transcriptional regulator [Neisseriaceae bacterium]|nr:helix-turn-helix transcriptional regulator [Neisseriaceae bacterium]
MELQKLINFALVGMSQAKLAAYLGKSQPTIYRMSKGMTLKTDIETIRKLEDLVSDASRAVKAGS